MSVYVYAIFDEFSLAEKYIFTFRCFAVVRQYNICFHYVVVIMSVAFIP